jgi:hypothetical protein
MFGDINMKDLLFNPNVFFSEKSKNEVNLKYPVMIMLVLDIIFIGDFFLSMNLLRRSLPSNVNASLYFMILGIFLLVFAIAVLIGIFGFWIIVTGILFLISSVFKPNGSFKRTLEFVSYGFVPNIFSLIVISLLSNIYLSSLNISSLNFSTQNSHLFTESLRQAVTNSPLTLVSQIFGILTLLWSANIWIFALVHARNISIKNATITVGIPVGMNLVYSVIQIYFRLRERY